MRFIVLALLISCGGSSAEWAGKWRQTTGFPTGTFVECTLAGSGTTITGSGVQHREAGTDLPFGVSGTTTAGVTFTYPGGTTETFTFSQPDTNDITLSNGQRTVALVRE